MEASELAGRLLGLVVLLLPTYFFWGPWLTRKWPTTRATVVEVEPTNPDGLFARYRRFRRGIDYGIEYEVDGLKHTKNPHIEGFVKIDGFSATSFPIVPREFDLRYAPDNPNRISLVHAYRPGYVWSTTILCFVAGTMILWWNM